MFVTTANDSEAYLFEIACTSEINAMTAHIGTSIHIKGTIAAEEPLTVAGQVEGSIIVTGHALTVTQTGRVDAEVVADVIVIDGTAKGKFNAATRITVHETATVIGEISTAALAVAEGATVHGRVDTGVRKILPAQAPTIPTAGTSAA